MVLNKEGLTTVAVEALRNEERDKLSPLLESGDLEDGGKTTIKCSSCDKPLVSIWIVRPNADIVSDIYANCPYCGDKSFVHKFNGQFYIGHLKDTVITDTLEEEFLAGNDGSIYQKIKLIVMKE